MKNLGTCVYCTRVCNHGSAAKQLYLVPTISGLVPSSHQQSKAISAAEIRTVNERSMFIKQ
jgi:hypothetical protein